MVPVEYRKFASSASLVGLLQARAREFAGKRAYTFLADGETQAEWLTYADLDRRARAIGADLQRLGMAGQRVLLLLPPGLDFVAAFFGCLYGGAVAVPAYPPASRRSLPRLRSIASDARPAAALTLASNVARFDALAAEVPELQGIVWRGTDEVPGELAAEWSEPEGLSGETLAFLQYTSGSTSAPKGVMVSHGNLLHNERMIRSAFEQSEESVVVGWLPLYHDMGLIGNVLQPLFAGASCVLMAPVAFLQKPLRWLEAVSRYRATTSGGPNFAYELCVRKVSEAEKAGLDLGNWRVAYSGAEPVRAETLDRFAAAFAGCGFRREAFYPCYGLAEATLFVTGGAVAAEPVAVGFSAEALATNRAERVEEDGAGRPLVGCGGPWLGQEVAVADPETGARQAGEAIGEIWVAGPSVAQGYWNRPDVTEQTFRARLAGEPGAGPFLRTGDLGFLSGGQLFVTGRLKDLIIIRGRNLYPQDVELTAERSHSALRPGCGAAFAVDVAGEERLVVVQEVERHRDSEMEEAAAAIRRAVAEEHEVQVHDVVLVRTGTIAKTSSGKIQRHAIRRAWLEGSLAVVGRNSLEAEQVSQPAPAALDATALVALPAAERTAAVTAWVGAAAARALRISASRIDPRGPLAALGLDSLGAVELKNELEVGLGASLPLTSFLGDASVESLAGEVLAGGVSGPLAVETPDSGAEHPLTHGQEGLWFLDRLDPGNPACVIAGAARVRGLDVAALRRSFERLAERHGVLRTTFAAGESGPVQRIGEEARFDFVEVDASSWSEGRLARCLADFAFAPFDLEAGPLLRAGVFHRPAGESCLALSVHHIVADLWSLGVLLSELGELYAQGGHRSPWAPLAASFAEHARRQRRLLAGPEGVRLEAYWLEKLAGSLEPLDLPTDRPRPRTRSGRGGVCSLRLDPVLAAGLRELAARRGVTPFAALLASYQILLARYSGQSEVLVGSPTTGRGGAGGAALGGLVGYFVNPVVLRGDLSGEPSFGGLLDRSRRVLLEAFAHQDFPFPLLAERLQPERDSSRPPVFQAALALQKARRPEEEGIAGFALGEAGARLSLGGLELESLPLARRYSQFDLTLLVADERGGLAAALEHDADLFDLVTARRMLGHFRNLLAGALADPDTPVSRLSLLDAAERHQALVEWNGAGGLVPEEVPVHEQLDRWAEETPEAAAVIADTEDAELLLTYEELKRRADGLARHLRAMGIGPESRVALGLERSPELVTAALGTLKAGGAYLPLDPEYPAERLRYVLDDAGASALLTVRRLAGRFDPPEGVPVLFLDEGLEVLPEDGGDPPRPVLPENLAYVIYTSGSTGLPKGTELRHGGLASLVRWHREAFGLRPGDRTTLLAGPGFDASVWEMWSCLAAGGTLCIPRRDTAASPEALVRWLAERGIRSAFLPTPLAEALLEQELPSGFALRTLLTGGDRLRSRPASGAPFRLFNCYGPTEATVVATSSPVPARGTGLPAIGRPLPETQGYVVDRTGEPVPAGVAGELWLGGAGLARGYLGRPELTAERFIPDPFGGTPGSRLYRTGDLVRLRQDGELEFLGRIDHQVKVRGFRIELGEIEACLTAHPVVREAVVLARPDSRGDNRLVAWVVTDEATADLASFLRIRLPEHMVPTAWSVLASLPLTPNGKVDRKALPEAEETAGPEQSMAPRTPEEELLAGIFAEVLGRERVGTGEDFFALGGHSLLATRVASRVRDIFGVELPVRRVFEAPTVAELAADLAGRADKTPGLTLADRSGDLPLSFAQERLWFLEQLQPGLPTYNVPAAVRLEGELDVDGLRRALSEVVARHEALRTTFEERGGRPVQRIAPEGSVDLPLVDLREDELALAAAEEARRPFDLTKGPLLRARLLRLSSREHVLLLTMHHIVSDGWSVGVLVRELGELYAGSASLEPLSVQYADYAAWQRDWLRDEALASRLSWWRESLAGAPSVLELPSDRPRPAVSSGRGGQVRVAFSADLSRGVEELARRRGATRFMVLLAGFAALLHRYGGQDEVVVGAPIAGRTRRELEPLVGLFVNSLALRVDLAGDPAFAGLLARARETALSAYAWQDLPFEKLVEELAPQRSLAHNPVFQVMLAMQPAPELSLPGLAVRRLEVDARASRLDLMLSLEERDGELAGFFEYSADLFDAATVERLSGHLSRLLAAAAEDETRRLWDLPLLSEPERLQVVEEWNRTAAPFPSDLCLHELVAAQVARTPDAEALVWGEESLTYAELWRRSGQIAARLHGEPGGRVGVLSERTPWMVAGLLGVLRAGAAYVPMDPAYPAERLAYIAEDARLSAVLTTEGLAHRIAPGVPRVLLGPEMAGEVPFTGRSLSSQGLAYIIYTSGSTGRPKGVAIEHRSAVALLSWAAEEFSAGELAGVLAATSICFDLSVFELFLPLALGGTVILADDALALASLPAAGRVRLINTVPSAIAELDRAGAIPPSVRTINLAGEPLRRALADRLYRHETVERVLNLYGPSEDTTYSTWALVERDGTLAPPIGRPLSNSQAYVLDRRMEPAPVGVPGVLHLGGVGLARGYFGRPELTAERFIPNPFGGLGERLYDTGDLVRWLPDGNLDFLGRVDHQVKVRGFRIELGEVESAAGAHPAAQETVAVVRRSGEEASLVLYVAPRAGQSLAARDLRSFLDSRLPAYMVPSAIVLLEALPLTPNGKVDRKALPAPDLGAEGATGATAPRTPAEELLAGIWADVLGVSAVGVHDGFFDLGGHSLLATRVVARVRRAFGVELPLRALFERPTVASLAARIEAEMGSASELPPVVPVPRGETLPLSYAQQRLWFLDQLEPGSPLYNVPVALRLRGRLDAGALAGAFREVVRRHEALRTVFTSRDGAPVQILLPEVEAGLDALDLRDLPAGLREAEAGRRMREEARRPFALERGPLFRLALFRLAEEEHLLLVTLHHIVSDGWSMGVLVREVAALYTALSQGRAADLPALPVQYADYAVWQRSWLEGGALETQLAYWRERLGGAPAVLEVPADRLRPLARSHRGASRPFSLPADLSAALAALARGREATPFMTLLAGFQTLLARWCGRDEVSTATAIAGRRHVETEALIGFFVNTLVLRTSLAGEPGFGELLGRVRETTLGAYTHQDLPFERLVEEIQPERSLAHAPLAQVMLVLQNAPLEELELPGLDARVIELDNGAAKLDLTLLARETADGLAGTLVYDAELFTEATAARLLDHLRELLAGAVADPDRPWTALPLLTPAEQVQLLEQGSAVHEAAQPVFIHELFAERARTAPETPALRFEDLELTYAGLNRRADLLARRLRALGVGPETRVALYAGRSAEMVVGLLAVLKAGGAYVPIDPGAPAERIAFVLADTAAPVALTQAALADRLPVREGLSVLLLDEETAEEPGDLEPVLLRPENLAYVIYTSGSTGRPKGVTVEHRQLANYVLGVTERLGLEGCASFATVSTLAADLGNTALFPALVTGACLHVISRERAADPEAFADYLERHGIDVLKIVPSHLAALQSVERPERGLPRRRLVLGGEAATWELAGLLRSRAPECLVCNHYGPTETTVGVLARPIPGEEERLSATVPLGRPLPGSRVYVLDRRQELLPAGVPGELCIGGAGLSRGYLGRPGLTAERFVPDPFGGPGERIYRTGDLARVLPDGEVEFLGRIDHQVKIRGFRVEPGEVAAALERHPAVREAVVLGEGGRLIAYAVPAGEEPSAAGLRDFLSGELPDYMIPAAFVFLAAIPLTPNGKVDREALPRPEMEVAVEGYVAPRTPVEETLAGIWAELLGLDRVGIHDGFFDLGGHSLMATRLISRVRRTFEVELPLRSLFEAPTPAGLALAVEAARRAHRADTTLAAPPLVRRDHDADIEGALSFSQERLWFLDQLHPGQSTYNVPYFARLEGALDVGALASALAEISRRHESLRTTFPAVDGRPLPVVSPGARLELRVEDLRDLSPGCRAAEAERRRREEAERPFDLADGPLARAVLLRLDEEEGEQEHELLLTFHHVVSDAWSRGVLTRELEALYAAFASGRPSPLPELPLQYADFAAWQRAWMRGEVLEGELAFWREALGAGSPPLQLHADRPRPAVLGPAGGVHTFRLEAELGRSVRDLAGRHGATPFMVLLAGFAALLGRLSGQDDVTVGSPVANRNRAETEGLIGFFVNTLALRVRMDGDPEFGGLVEQVRATAVGAYDHQDLPFEKLVEAVFRERALDRSPVFQTAFLLQNAPAPRPELPGLAVTPLEVHNGTAKFDLTLALTGEGEELAGAFEYAADLFDPATLERWAGHLAVLLRGACADPAARLSALPVLSAAERRQLLEMAEPLPPLADVCLHELFAATAQRMPAATALVTPEETLTYAALASRAGRLATRLRDIGVRPETRVGVFMERSADLVVGLLAILEAGGAYVPLDPAYPEERLAFMAEDAGLVAVLAGERMADRLPGRILEAGVPVVSPAVDGEAWTGPVPATAAPGNLAYLIYTSGSTGRPKAVAIEHRSAVALLAWAARLFSPEETEAVLACTSISFDLSVFEIFLPLSRGARVVLAENALALPTLAAAGEVTLVNTVPSAMNELVRMGAVPPSVRTVSLAGEPLPRALADRIYALGTVEKVFNLYGPSEDTTYSTWSLVPESEGRPPAIGRPIAGSQGYVVDAAGGLAPWGVAGELWLGGAGLARGYLGRPELTAEKFIPDPFGGMPGGRLYRTGDLVRLRCPRQDGELEFLGRIDHQVKVRGFRIELGEIEACLTEHPAVREAVVQARDNRLVAWVVTEAVPTDLTSFMRERLPEHMVPTAWSMLAALPLTPNGKVDRKALPEPEETSGPDLGAAPRTPEEELLAGIFAEVLGRERVGTGEDFFALGGHSLLATRVASRVREAFGVELPVRRVFEAPTVAELAQDLLNRGDKPEAPELTLADRFGDLPLSFAQERLWFLEQLQPGLPTYNVPAAVRLDGELDVDGLRWALSEVVTRHEALRTTFEERGGRPVQRIAPEGSVELALVDLEGLGGAEAALAAAEEARRPFDLVRGPLVRASLLRLSNREHVLLLTMHHIVSDGWSVGVLVRELGELYAAGLEGRPASLEPLAVQYADYAAWQREWLKDEALEARLSWWRERLAGAPSVLELPSDRPRPAVSSGRGGQVRVAFSPELSRGVEELARRRGSTRFMVLLAGFAALLHRYGGQEEVVVGAPIAGRTRRELEPLVGLFVNSLALRVDLAGDPAFAGLLARARETALESYAWQDLPFEKLVEELAPQRSLAHNPVFQVMLSVQPALPALTLPGLTVRELELDAGASRLDLTLSLEENDAGLAGFLEYSSDLFDAATVERMAGHLARLLAAAAEDETRRTWDLPLLSEPERLQVVEEWNRTEAPFPADVCLHELVAAQVARTPDAEALVWGEESLTFAELWRMSGQVAARLVHLGIEVGGRVGVLSERTPWMVAGLLGVLRAGAAYVPMDPAYPAERLAYIAENGELSAVLTTERLAGLAGEFAPGLPQVILGAEPESVEVSLEHRGLSRSLAYLIYTSGSTGRPKGVAIEHRSAVAMLSWSLGMFPPEEISGMLASTSICFDMSVFELFLPLAAGGTIFLADDALQLRDLPAAGRVRLINTVPSAIAELDRAGAIPLSVRTINLGGEPLRRALVDRLYRHETVERVINLYGPSEDTTYSTWSCVERGSGREPVIGRLLSNSQGYVLDRRMKPVPVGVPGVLYLAGAGLARGYFGRPELTAEKLIPNPFGGPGERLYDTGDLVRWLPDGTLDYLGRMDHQVKVRGFRVELGEVESAAGAHPAVQEAVALVRCSAGESGASLVLYAVPRPGEPLTVKDLRGFLGSRLPSYMVPSGFVLLEALPLNPNGKVDRKVLAGLAVEAASERPYAAPRTPVEETLAGIWCSVLGVERVGIHDDFFELGGHSLLATQVLTRVRETFEVPDLPLRQLFQEPTVAELALTITQRCASDEDTDELLRTIQELKTLSPEDLAFLLEQETDATTESL